MLSKNNPRVKYLRRLTNRRFRELEGKFLAEGIRFVEEALESAFPLETLVYCPNARENDRGRVLLETASAKGIPTMEVDAAFFKELADTVTPQGVLAVLKHRWYNLNDLPVPEKPWLLVLVDGVLDPGNLGGIVRSADAAGADGLILLKGTADIFNPKALRATMGSIFHIPVIPNSSLEEVKSFFERHNIKLIAGVPRGGKPVFEKNLTGSCALLVGSEPRGPGEAVMSEVSEFVHIPMPGRAESLNVAVSTAILLYEAVRQRGFSRIFKNS